MTDKRLRSSRDSNSPSLHEIQGDSSPPLRITKSSTNFSKNNVYSGLMLGLKNALQIRL
jgi:hypothetical protein